VRLTLFAGFAVGSAVVLETMKSDRRQLEASIAAAQAEIAERRRIEETLVAARAEAEEANRLKDEFLAMVSHELRTPLNAIMGWVALLRGGGLSPPRAAHALEVIDRNARLQASLVADLLDVGRSLTGQLHIEPSRQVDLVALVRNAAEQTRDLARDKGVELRVEVPDEDLPVWGEPERLEQVVAKLLTNAIKFTPASERVTLSLARAGSSAEIVVADTGVGIPPKFLPHVFERFTQADTGSTRQHGGLGLGLAIVRQLVELHRGHIEAASDGDGHGARFTVRLPVDRGTAHPDDRLPIVLQRPSPTDGRVTGVAMPALPASPEET
jgi:signal transduction histidine kinase